MIVSKTDTIPTKKIVAVVGKISIKIFETYKGAEEGEAMQILIRKAKTIRADAIINFTRSLSEPLGIKAIYSCDAVLTEDIKPFWETVYCGKCGKPNKRYYEYCMHCGKRK